MNTKQKAVIANPAKRIKAFIIDLFLILMPLLYITTYIVLDGKEDFQNSQFAIAICQVIFGLICVLFFTIKAQTPGYKAQEIYLVDLTNGRKIGFLHALIRYICFVIAGFSILGLLLCFFRKDRLNLHDILTKSAAVCKKTE
ncbi:MAG: RDD family protein [Campylobacter sp.]|nr:RDD family protein [Campylobacter sp.]